MRVEMASGRRRRRRRVRVRTQGAAAIATDRRERERESRYQQEASVLVRASWSDDSRSRSSSSSCAEENRTNKGCCRIVTIAHTCGSYSSSSSYSDTYRHHHHHYHHHRPLGRRLSSSPHFLTTAETNSFLLLSSKNAAADDDYAAEDCGSAAAASLSFPKLLLPEVLWDCVLGGKLLPSFFSQVGDGRRTRENSDSKRMKRGSSSISSTTLVPVIQPQFERAQQLNVRPDHLVVLVHGILASPSDWKYVEGELKSRLGNKFLIHASSVNSFLQTLAGIDLGGKRLADEVQQIVDGAPSLKRISFVAHSLGGLFARYAIAMLHTPQVGCNEDVILLEELESQGGSHEFPGFQQSHEEAKVAGLEAVNFITLASPHLGVRGKKQLPFLLGVPVLEKIAAPIAPFVVGQTGKQLFLTDGKPSDPPLLLRMASDCQEGPFISALRAFKSRVVYANVSYDHMVGWRTSSIRRESELSKPPRNSLNGYKHIVNVMYCPAVESKLPSFEQETARAKAAAQVAPSSKKAASYHDILEEEMVRGLQQVSWRKVDVSFHSALWPFLAHNAIHVKQEWLHYEGAGVIAHVADTLKQQELCVSLEASL